MMFLLILGIVMLLVYGNESQQRGSTMKINKDKRVNNANEPHQ
jgi:hypothetical protein